MKTQRQTSSRTNFFWSKKGILDKEKSSRVTMETLKNTRNAVTFEFLEQSLKKRKFRFESRMENLQKIRSEDSRL